MESKLFEIRDRMTFIAVLATAVSGADGYLARRVGFNSERFIFLTRLDSAKSQYNSYDWGDRTMAKAHEYIEQNWDTLNSEDVIDVEFILGETETKKVSERFG